jgi:peptidoglycan/LPS O-acetylase OafA/YrhL
MAGALTYPLYLIHQDIGFTAFSYLRNLAPAWILAALTYLAMLGIAWLIHRGVEQPLAPVLRRKLSVAVDGVRRSGSRCQAASETARLGANRRA